MDGVDPRCWECLGFGHDCAGAKVEDAQDDELSCLRGEATVGTYEDLFALALAEEEGR